jgi:biopolymer transport protein TolR
MRALKYRRKGLFAGINITPFTDVVLVLLIIFMVATPILIQAGLKVNLPKASTADIHSQNNIVITIDMAGNVYLDNDKVQLSGLRSGLVAALKKKPDAPVVIMGDREVRYDLVIQVLDLVRASGVSKLSLGVELKR